MDDPNGYDVSRFALGVYDPNGNVSWAVLSLTPTDVERCLALMGKVKELHDEWKVNSVGLFNEMAVWFFASRPAELDELDESHDLGYRLTDAEFEQFMQLPALDISLQEMQVYDTDVGWAGYPKHTDAQVTTNLLHKTLLLEALHGTPAFDAT